MTGQDWLYYTVEKTNREKVLRDLLFEVGVYMTKIPVVHKGRSKKITPILVDMTSGGFRDLTADDFKLWARFEPY